MDSDSSEDEDSIDPQRTLAQWPMPKLRLQVEDVTDKGAALVFTHFAPKDLLEEAVLIVMSTLYTPESCPRQ